MSASKVEFGLIGNEPRQTEHCDYFPPLESTPSTCHNYRIGRTFGAGVAAGTGQELWSIMKRRLREGWVRKRGERKGWKNGWTEQKLRERSVVWSLATGSPFLVLEWNMTILLLTQNSCIVIKESQDVVIRSRIRRSRKEGRGGMSFKGVFSHQEMSCGLKRGLNICNNCNDVWWSKCLMLMIRVQRRRVVDSQLTHKVSGWKEKISGRQFTFRKVMNSEWEFCKRWVNWESWVSEPQTTLMQCSFVKKQDYMASTSTKSLLLPGLFTSQPWRWDLSRRPRVTLELRSFWSSSWCWWWNSSSCKRWNLIRSASLYKLSSLLLLHLLWRSPFQKWRHERKPEFIPLLSLSLLSHRYSNTPSHTTFPSKTGTSCGNVFQQVLSVSMMGAPFLERKDGVRKWKGERTNRNTKNNGSKGRMKELRKSRFHPFLPDLLLFFYLFQVHGYNSSPVTFSSLSLSTPNLRPSSLFFKSLNCQNFPSSNFFLPLPLSLPCFLHQHNKGGEGFSPFLTEHIPSLLSFNPWIIRPPFLPLKSRSLHTSQVLETSLGSIINYLLWRRDSTHAHALWHCITDSCYTQSWYNLAGWKRKSTRIGLWSTCAYPLNKLWKFISTQLFKDGSYFMDEPCLSSRRSIPFRGRRSPEIGLPRTSELSAPRYESWEEVEFKVFFFVLTEEKTSLPFSDSIVSRPAILFRRPILTPKLPSSKFRMNIVQVWIFGTK